MSSSSGRGAREGHFCCFGGGEDDGGCGAGTGATTRAGFFLAAGAAGAGVAGAVLVFTTGVGSVATPPSGFSLEA